MNYVKKSLYSMLAIAMAFAVMMSGASSAQAGINRYWGETFVNDDNTYTSAEVTSVDFDAVWAKAVQDAIIIHTCKANPGSFCFTSSRGSSAFWGAGYDYGDFWKM